MFIMKKRLQLVNPMVFICLFTLISIQDCQVHQTPVIEDIAINDCWVSPLWGTNTSRFVRQTDGTVWILGLEGKYPSTETVIYRRGNSSTWTEVKRIGGCYQPSVILLDDADNLHILVNSLTDPIKHYKGVWTSDSLHISLVAEADWDDGGRGWYLGAGIFENRIYLAFTSNDYDLWLTWKSLTEDTWSEPLRIFDGYVDPGGNHAMLYPRFVFSGETGYIMASHTSDGSTYNFKDGVFLYSFQLNDPGTVVEEAIWSGRKGYDGYGFDMILDHEGEVIVAYASGHHFYGEIDSSVGPDAIFTTKRQSDNVWVRTKIRPQRGFLSLSKDDKGNLYAFTTKASYAEGLFIPYRSVDGGASWQEVDGIPTADDFSATTIWAGLQGLQLGSSAEDRGANFPIYLAALLPDTTALGLKRYQLRYTEWQVDE